MLRLNLLADRLRQDISNGLIAGAAVEVGRRDGTVFEATVGLRDAELGDLLQQNAIWRIFSMTKPLVTAAALVLVERGVLHLDQPLADFLPACSKLRIATSDGSVAAERLATVQDLMRHTAGFAYGYVGDSPARRALVKDGFLEADLPLVDFVDRLVALPLEYQPGTAWHYSHATEVLGRVIELLTGDTLEGALRTTLLDPLAMSETAFSLPEYHRSRVAEPMPQPRGARPTFFDPCRLRRHQSAGGGLVSTIRDYGRFLRMLLGRGTLDGNRVLSPAAVSLMSADHLGSAFRKNPYYPPGPGYGFGLGVAVRTDAGLAPFPGSVGDYFWSGVGGTYFWLDPSLDLYVLLMLQSSCAVQRQHYRMLARNMVYAALT